MNRITINVGGIKFETDLSTLRKFPGSRLSKLSNQENADLFFDRNPYIFSFILDSYRYGSIHVPHDICSTYLQEEIEFWELPLDAVQPCCLKALYGQDESVQVIESLYEIFEHLKLRDGAFTEVQRRSKMTKIWKLVDDAKSSRPALIYAILVFCCTIGTLLMTAFRSVNMFEGQKLSEDSVKAVAVKLGMDSTNPKLVNITTRPSQGALLADMIFGIFLCVDTLLRLIFSPNKRQYLKCIINLADIVHLFGFVLLSSLFASGIMKIEGGTHALWLWVILKAMDCFKVMRLFRLCLNLTAVKLMQTSLQSSSHELSFLFLCVLTFTTLLGPLVVLAEFNADGNINDLFTSIWWALVTMTTVGYGDHYPVSAGGRVVGAVCAVLGVVLLAMPIGILASSFNDKNSHYNLVNKHSERQRNRKKPSGAVTFSSLQKDKA